MTNRTNYNGWNRNDDMAWKFIGSGSWLNKRGVDYEATAKSIEIFAEEHEEDLLWEMAKDAVNRFVYLRPLGVGLIDDFQEKVMDAIKKAVRRHPVLPVRPYYQKHTLEFENMLEIIESHVAYSTKKFILVFHLEITGNFLETLPQNHPLKAA